MEESSSTRALRERVSMRRLAGSTAFSPMSLDILWRFLFKPAKYYARRHSRLRLGPWGRVGRKG